MSDIDSDDDVVGQKKKSVKVVAPGEEKMKAIGARRKQELRNSDLSDSGDEADFNNDGGEFAPGKASYVDRLKRVSSPTYSSMMGVGCLCVRACDPASASSVCSSTS